MRIRYFSGKTVRVTCEPLLRRPVLGRVLAGAAVAGLSFAAMPAAHAQFAYVSSILNPDDPGSPTPFGLLNVATGSYQFIGNTSVGLYGLNIVGSTVYGIGADRTLYIVNQTTGALTVVDASITGGQTIAGSLTSSPGGTNYNLQNSTDAGNVNAYVYTLNINGNSSSFSPFTTINGNGNTGIRSDGGLSYDPSTGFLFGTQGDQGNGVFAFNTTNGNLEVFNPSSGFINNENTYTLFNNGKTDAASNILYAIDFGDFEPVTPNPSQGHVYTINKTTGAAVYTGTNYNFLTAGRIQAGAYIVGSEVPEPSSASLVFLALGSVSSMGLIRRRAARLRH